MRRPSLFTIRDLSLRNKILIPYFLILILLGATATFGSALFIHQTLTRTVDDRLHATRRALLSAVEEKKSALSALTRLLADRPRRTSPPLEKTLAPAGIVPRLASSPFFPEQEGDSPQAPDREHFFFDIPPGDAPILTLAPPEGNLLLRAPLDRPFLQRYAAPMETWAAILTAEGDLLASSSAKLTATPLNREELRRLSAGESFYKTVSSPLPHRHFIGPLPGSKGLLLEIELPLTDLELIVHTLATRSVLTILAALLIGAFLYVRLIARIMRPVKALKEATLAVSQGDLDYRIEEVSRDEFGHLASSFNAMVSQIATLYRDRLEQERRLTEANDELKYKGLLEEKNAEILRANSELKLYLDELQVLLHLNQSMISTLDLNTLFDRMLETLSTVLQCDGMTLLMYDPRRRHLEVRKALGVDLTTTEGVTFSLEEGITGYAARKQKLIYIPDLALDPRRLSYKGQSPTTGSMVSAPMFVRERLIGALNLHKPDRDGFSDSETKLIQAVANQAAMAIENAQLYEETRRLSNTDELTGLANRRHFNEILDREFSQAERFGSPCSLILIDIDHFKRFNDTHGHLQGDLVLRRVADTLRLHTRGIDTVARFGGEEFIVLLTRTEEKGALAAAEKLRGAIYEEDFSGADQSQPLGRITLSLGVACYPQNGVKPFELIERADQALYRAKEEGRNRTVLFRAAE